MSFKDWLLIENEQEGFEKELDKEPSDFSTRLVYADWLEENGDTDLALAQRWIVKHKKYPCGRWIWGRARGSNSAYEILSEIFNRLTGTPQPSHYDSLGKHTRQEAERDLGNALK